MIIETIKIILTVIFYLSLKNLKVQRAMPWQFLSGVKYRISFSYWKEYRFELFKTT